jgi:scyllo-inositol 2-dehydrogenase (NADP+)
MKKLRAGVIGLGRSGYDIHVHTMSLLPDLYEVAAVADPLADRVAEATATTGCKGFADYRSMLDAGGLDLVVNASPSNFHVPITLDVLDRGFDIMCDKPFARRVAEVDELVAKAKAKGRRLFAYQQSRFAPYFTQVRKVIDSGVLGRIVMIKVAFNGFARRWDWQTLQENNGGNLLNTGPHPLDQALQLFGEAEEPQVFCLMDRANTFGDAEDHVKLILHGKKSPTIDLEISSCSAHTPYTYQVAGTRGSLTGTMTHIEWKYFVEAEAPKQVLIREPLPGRAYCREELPWKEASWDVPEEQKNLFDFMGTSLYRDLYAAITEGKEPVVRIPQVRRQIAVIEECHRQNPLSRIS